MEKGSVEGRTYKNASIGLELTVADGLEFQTPELKGTPGTLPLLVTVTAWRQEGLLSPRKVTAFYADALAYYPEGQRSTDAYMAKAVRGNRQTGYEPVEENLKTSFGGMSFARTDFRGPLYEAVLVKAYDTQAFVFIFASSSKDTVDALVAATSLKLDRCVRVAVLRAVGISDGVFLLVTVVKSPLHHLQKAPPPKRNYFHIL
jgi:hypothetical protein